MLQYEISTSWTLPPFVIALRELRKDGTNRTKRFSNWWCCNLSRSNYALCTAATHIIQAWGEWPSLRLHGQKSKIMLQIIPNGKRPATDVCVNLMLQSHALSYLKSNYDDRDERLVCVACMWAAWMDTYTTKSVYVCVCLHLLSLCLYEQSMSKRGRV